MKIIVIDKITRFTTDRVKSLQKLGEVMFTPLDKNILKNLPKEVYKDDVIVAPDPDVFEWKIKNEELEMFTKLKAICLPTTSYEWLDLDYCKKNNIIVTNTPNYSTEAVAEYAVWMMMSLVRKLPMIMNGKMDVFNQDSLQEEIKGKVAGIIGLGNIGSRIAEYCDRMGMKVIYHSRSQKDTFFEKVSLKKLLKTSDFIFPCFEINRETKKIFTNKNNINSIKKKAYIIIPIIGGGEKLGKQTFSFNYLFKRVRARKLAGLAFESPKQMKTRANIFTPPPVAWYTKEAQERCYEQLTKSIIAVAKGKPINEVT